MGLPWAQGLGVVCAHVLHNEMKFHGAPLGSGSGCGVHECFATPWGSLGLGVWVWSGSIGLRVWVWPGCMVLYGQVKPMGIHKVGGLGVARLHGFV